MSDPGQPRRPPARLPRGPWPTATTRPVFLLGWPVHHSLSPQLHNAAFREQGLDLVYLVAPTPPDALLDVVAALGAIGAIGANVTVPHKRAVVSACDVLTDEARLIGAVNTLTWAAEGLIGDNSDALGLAEALSAEIDPAPGDRYVLFGTGGAARAAAVAIGRLDGEVTVIGRRDEAARDIASLADRAGARRIAATTVDDSATLETAVAEARTVINATPLGMGGEDLPPPFHRLNASQIAYDLVYDPPTTPFLAAAQARGAGAHHGLGMLVGQAAVSYRRWTAQPAPVATMSAAALAALARRGDRGH
ncbi:MAG: shikimate dehydrogenase [Nitriliruptoraceae bacterium]